MVQEFNILNITYPFMLANDVTISKKKNAGKKILLFKIQDGGRRPYWKSEVVSYQALFNLKYKCDTWFQIDLISLNSFPVSNLSFELKFKMAADGHIELW